METNPKQTGKNSASKAGPLLVRLGTSKSVKTVAGSDLSQAPFKKAPPKPKKWGAKQ